MKRTREESSAAKDIKGEEVPLVGTGGEKSTAGGTKVDARRWVRAERGYPKRHLGRCRLSATCREGCFALV